MNHYELLFVLKPTLTDEETKAQIAKIQDSITAQDATIVATDDMGMRKLAYPVEKNERGYYTVTYFQAPGVAIAEIERQLRINEEILKFMTVKYTNKKEIGQFTKMANAAAAKQEVSAKEEAPAPVTEETPATEAPAAEAAPETKEA
jgi:small subunit ribosomal protein S6